MSAHAHTLVLAAHPDDAEIGAGGTVLKLTAAGRRVVLVDCTRGEQATLGSPQERAREAAAAARALGVAERVNLGLPDAALAPTEEAVAQVVSLLRLHRPRLLLAHLDRDLHPDHAAAGQLARKAFYLAGLRRFLPGEPPHRPRLLAFFPGHLVPEPDLCVDISDVFEAKRAAVHCYASQVSSGATAHLVSGIDPLARMEARNRHFGHRIGRAFAEPFCLDGPVPVDSLCGLLGLGDTQA